MNMIFIFIIIWTDNEFEKIRLRDPEAFEKMYNEYKLKLYNFIILKVNGDADVAEEILSDTVYSALISAPSIKSKDKVLSWLFRIANRRFCDYLRKKYRDKKIKQSLEKERNDFVEENEENNDEKIVMMKSAMENLKPVYKELIKMKYIEDKSQREIAEHFNKSRISVESMIFRAKEALKKEIKKIYREAV
ncbi:MAG: RNA polymerase sigma factor [Spirochaetes bacterium]|nr:RNA polymerase sigma factor [Spirochaetota bacterium]